MRIEPAKTARALGLLLLVTGTTHFVRPGIYRDLIPSALPGTADSWVYGSGVAELACAGLLVVPRTRRVGGYAAAILLVGVLPGNAWMAWQWRDRSVAEQLIAYGRLPVQVPLVLWALYSTRAVATPPSRMWRGAPRSLWQPWRSSPSSTRAG